MHHLIVDLRGGGSGTDQLRGALSGMEHLRVVAPGIGKAERHVASAKPIAI